MACTDCGYLIVEKNTLIEKLRGDLTEQENRSKDLQEQFEKQNEILHQMVEENNGLKFEVSSLHEQLNSDENSAISTSEKTQVLASCLQQQLEVVSDEKKKLCGKLSEFEKNTEELFQLFEQQEAKYEKDLAHKQKVVETFQKERKLMENDCENIRNDLVNSKEIFKKQIEQLKATIQEKDTAIVNLSELHNEAMKQSNALQRDLVNSEEFLHKELVKKDWFEEKITSLSNEKTMLFEELNQIKAEKLKTAKENVDLNTKKSNMADNIEQLKNKIKDLAVEKDQNLDEIQKLHKINENLATDKKIMEEKYAQCQIEIAKLKKCLKESEECIENQTSQLVKNGEDIENLEEAVRKLQNDEKIQRKRFDSAKEELEQLLTAKESLDKDYSMLNDVNSSLNMKVRSLTKENNKLSSLCETNAKEIQDLEENIGQKTQSIVLLREQEKRFKNQVNELTHKETELNIELKKCREDMNNLLRENKMIDEHYQKVNLQLQECLSILDEKREEYLTVRKRLEDQLKSQIEETSRFKEHNSEINTLLKERDNELVTSSMEKQELQRSIENIKNDADICNSKKKILEDEMAQMKTELCQWQDEATNVSEKLDEAEKQVTEVEEKLKVKCDCVDELQNLLNISREEVHRWKKLSDDYKEERNTLQKQIEELDRCLNERSVSFTEEKSSLEKSMASLRNVIQRLKNNEEILRNKIEDLRNEVEDLSQIKSEQQSQLRRLNHENERLLMSLEDYNKIVEDNTKLLKANREYCKELGDLKKDLEVFDDKLDSEQKRNEKLLEERNCLEKDLQTSGVKLKETTQQLKDTKYEVTALKESNAEVSEERERLLNENCRLKEKKAAMIEERKKLQEMIESLDKCHREKNENLHQKTIVLAKELDLNKAALKTFEEKQASLLETLQQKHEEFEAVLNEDVEIRTTLKKTDIENTRLRKKITEMMKEIENLEKVKDDKVCLKIAFDEQVIRTQKLQSKEKVLNILISKLNQQHTQHKDEYQQILKENNEVKAKMSHEREEKMKHKESSSRLKQDVQNLTIQRQQCIEELKKAQDALEQALLGVSRLEKEKQEVHNLLEQTTVNHQRKIDEIYAEKAKQCEYSAELERDFSNAKTENVELEKSLRLSKEASNALTSEKIELERELARSIDKTTELSNDLVSLEKECRSLREHSQNLEKVFATKNSAMSDHTTQMEKQIIVLRDTLTQVRAAEDKYRNELEETKRRLEKEKSLKLSLEIQLNEVRLKRERLEGKNDELLSNCERLEELVNKGVELKHEKEGLLKALENERQKNISVESQLESKLKEMLQLNSDLNCMRAELCKYKTDVEKYNSSNDNLVAENKTHVAKERELINKLNTLKEQHDEILSNNGRINERLGSQEKELSEVKKEFSEYKTKSEQEIEDCQNEKNKVENELKISEETLGKLIEKQQDLQESMRKSREETDDLECENEDLMAELEKSKEAYKKVKATLCEIQTEHGELQDLLQDKEKHWQEISEKTGLQKFELETKIDNFQRKLSHAEERMNKAKELENVLRNEIEELSDAYVKMEEEVHHSNRENSCLKEKIQELSQSIEEVELARDTALLLKEKRQGELLKMEKNIQHIEEELKHKEKHCQKLNKDLDNLVEEQKMLEVQLSKAKELNCERAKVIEETRSKQRKLEEDLWRERQTNEKQSADIATLKLNDNSMKVRIEMMEEETKNITFEKQTINESYKTCQNERCVLVEKLSQLTNEVVVLKEKSATFSNENASLLKEIDALRQQYDTELTKNTELRDAFEKLNESSCSLVTNLKDNLAQKHNDIIDLEKQKGEIVKSVADLNTKNTEIQTKVANLMTENERLTENLQESQSLLEKYKASLEKQSKEFVEKFETEEREKEQILKMKEFYIEAHKQTQSELEQRDNQLMRAEADCEQKSSEIISLMEFNRKYKDEIHEGKCFIEQLLQSLDIQKNKIEKVERECSLLLDEVHTLQNKLEIKTNELEKALGQVKDLTECNKKCNNAFERERTLLQETRVSLNKAQSKVDELQEAKYRHETEHNKITEELNKMKAELVVVCENFKKSTLKCLEQAKELESKQKCVYELENKLELSRHRENQFQLRNTELQTRVDLLGETREAVKLDLEKITARERDLECRLRDEKDVRLKEVSQQQSVIAELQINLDEAKKQVCSTKDKLEAVNNEKETLVNELKLRNEEFYHVEDKCTNLERCIEKLEVKLRETEVHYKNTLTRVATLEEDGKEKEAQQAYQFRNLEKVKESVENEVASMEEAFERFSQKLSTALTESSQEESVSFLNDSGIDLDSSFNHLPSSQHDTGKDVMVNQPITEDMNAKHVDPGCVHHLETTVERTVQLISVLSKNLQDKSLSFMKTEENFLNEIKELKKTISHDNDVRSFLQNDLQRLESAEKSLNNKLEEGRERQASYLTEITHLKALLAEKHKNTDMLNDFIQNSKERQAFLEDKVTLYQSDLKRERDEKCLIENEAQEQARKMEEMKESYLKENLEYQTKMTNFDKSILDLEREKSEAKCLISQLNDKLTTYESECSQFTNKIGLLENSLTEAQEHRTKAGQKNLELSKNLDNCRSNFSRLEESYRLLSQSYSNVEQEMTAGKQKVKDYEEIVGVNKQLVLEKANFAEKLKDKVKELEETRESLQTAEKSHRNGETRIKTIGSFLEQINICKNKLECEIDKAKLENAALRKENERLSREIGKLHSDIMERKVDVTRKENIIKNLEEETTRQAENLTSLNNCLQSMNEQVNGAKTQAKSLEIKVKTVHNMLDCWPLCETAERLDKKSIAIKSGSSHESLTEQMSELNNIMSDISDTCQQRLSKHQDILNELSQKTVVLKQVEEANYKLNEIQGKAEETLEKLSKKCSDFEDTCKYLENELKLAKDDLVVKSTSVTELVNTKLELKSEVKKYKDDISILKMQYDDSQKGQSVLKESLLAAESEVSKLKTKCTQMEVMQAELNHSKVVIKELRELQDKYISEKDEAVSRNDVSQRKLIDLDNEYCKTKQRLENTLKILDCERERVMATTKIARNKEKSLDELRGALKAKQEDMEQLQQRLCEGDKMYSTQTAELSQCKQEYKDMLNSRDSVANDYDKLQSALKQSKEDQERLQIENESLCSDIRKYKSKMSVLVDSYRALENDKRLHNGDIKDLADKLASAHKRIQYLEKRKEERQGNDKYGSINTEYCALDTPTYFNHTNTITPYSKR